MIDRLPLELRSGIVTDALAWFIACTGRPGALIDPKAQHPCYDPKSWADFASSVRAAAYRTPYAAIGDYMDRYWYLPEIFGERARLHRTRRSDHDRHLHDHPWHFVSVIVEGGYTEEIEVFRDRAGGVTERRRYRPGDVLFRRAGHRHRLELDDGQECWSLVFTSHNVRDWGFWTPEGSFIPWREYQPEEQPA